MAVYMSIILAFRRLRQENCQKLKARLIYVALYQNQTSEAWPGIPISLKLWKAWAEVLPQLHGKTLSQAKKKELRIFKNTEQ